MSQKTCVWSEKQTFFSALLQTTNSVSYCALTRHQQFRQALESMLRGSPELTRGRGVTQSTAAMGALRGAGGHLPLLEFENDDVICSPENGRFSLRRAEKVNF